MVDQQLLDADYVLGPSGGYGGGPTSLLIPDGATLVSLQVYTVEYVKKLILTYEQDEALVTLSMGDAGRGEAHPPVHLRGDEYIVSVRGTFGAYVNTIQLITNRASYGPWGGVEGPGEYRYDIPPGMRFAGIFGRSGLAVDALGVIIRQYDERRNDMSKWGAIAGQVAGIAANLIPSLFDASKEEPVGFQLGDILWLPNTATGEVNAWNTGKDDSGISFALAGPNSNLSVYQPLPSGAHYNATNDLNEFKNGQITIGREVQEGAADILGLARLMRFSVKWFALATSFKLLGGVELFVNQRTPGYYSVGIRSLSPPVTDWFARVRATDARGGSVTASSAIKSGSGSAEEVEYFIDLPPGIDLDPIVQQLELDLEVDEAFYMEATKERRALVRKGRPA